MGTSAFLAVLTSRGSPQKSDFTFEWFLGYGKLYSPLTGNALFSTSSPVTYVQRNCCSNPATSPSTANSGASSIPYIAVARM